MDLSSSMASAPGSRFPRARPIAVKLIGPYTTTTVEGLVISLLLHRLGGGSHEFEVLLHRLGGGSHKLEVLLHRLGGGSHEFEVLLHRLGGGSHEFEVLLHRLGTY